MRRTRSSERRCGYHFAMDFLLWILAVLLVVAGIIAVVRREIVLGVILIILGLLVGPGGVSLLS